MVAPRRVRALRVSPVVGILLGTFLVQVAWIVAVPPFRGIDEFDHVFRADAVAHGDWGPALVAPTEGRGGIVQVRENLVDAASTMCLSYEYTSDANCLPIERFADGRVSVATGAFAYHPVYYWLVGAPARFVDGDAALLVMRLVSALLCTLMLGAAYWALGLVHRSLLPRIGLLVGTTPVFLYSTSMVAPNGLEMTAGAAAWSGFLALSLRGPDLPHRSRVLLVTAGAAVVLTSLRQLGPVWLLLVVAMCLILGGLRPWVRLTRFAPVAIIGAVTTVGAATLAAYVWVVGSRSATLPPVTEPYPDPVGTAVSQLPLWFLQAIAAFPIRDDPAPVVVYATYLLVGTLLLGMAVRWGSTRTRLTLLLTIAVSALVPLAVTLATIESLGKTWQGRYGLPFSVGLFVLAGLALSHRGPPLRAWSRWLPLLAILLSIAHATSTVSVYDKELRNDAARASDTWPLLPAWVVGALAVTGVLVCMWTVWAAGDRSDRPEQDARREAVDPAASASRSQPSSGSFGLHVQPADLVFDHRPDEFREVERRSPSQAP